MRFPLPKGKPSERHLRSVRVLAIAAGTPPNSRLAQGTMGHGRTQMTEHYIAVAGLTAQVQAAALRVVSGTGFAPWVD